MREFKVAGKHILCDYSNDGTAIALGGWNGNARIVDAITGKVRGKFKVKGLNPQIRNHAISRDNRHYAFSCSSRIFVGEIASSEILGEWAMPSVERGVTCPLAFSADGSTLYFPCGDVVQVVDLTGTSAGTLPVPGGALCVELTLSPDGEWLAYKSRADRICDKLFLVHIRGQWPTRTLELPYEYVTGRSMYETRACWLDSGDMAVFRKGIGLSIYDWTSLKERERITWADLGGRSLFAFHKSRISGEGRIVAFIGEDGGGDASTWSVSASDGSQLIAYDRTAKAPAEVPRLDGGFSIHPDGHCIAALSKRRSTGGRTETFVQFVQTHG